MTNKSSVVVVVVVVFTEHCIPCAVHESAYCLVIILLIAAHLEL